MYAAAKGAKSEWGRWEARKSPYPNTCSSIQMNFPRAWSFQWIPPSGLRLLRSTVRRAPHFGYKKLVQQIQVVWGGHCLCLMGRVWVERDPSWGHRDRRTLQDRNGKHKKDTRAQCGLLKIQQALLAGKSNGSVQSYDLKKTTLLLVSDTIVKEANALTLQISFAIEVRRQVVNEKCEIASSEIPTSACIWRMCAQCCGFVYCTWML